MSAELVSGRKGPKSPFCQRKRNFPPKIEREVAEGSEAVIENDCPVRLNRQVDGSAKGSALIFILGVGRSGDEIVPNQIFPALWSE